MMRRILGLAGAMALAACGNIDESDPKPRLEALSAPGTTYGNTLIGTRKRLDFVLRNSDAGFAKVKPLTDIVASVTGTGLTLSQNSCPGTLNEGENCFLSIDYEPTAAGTLGGELRVTSNAKEGPITLALGGTAVSTLSQPSGAVAFGAPADGNFGSVPKGQKKSLTFVVRNIGNAPDTLTITFPTQAGWTFTDDCPTKPATLSADASCSIIVEFGPTSVGVLDPPPLVISDPYNVDYGGLSLRLRGTGS